MVFLDMDDKYGGFPNTWFKGMTHEQWGELTIREIVEKAMNESTEL
jgi:hypothetical protein